MKKINRYLTGLLVVGLIAGIALFQKNLFAEMVEGHITAINKQNQSITIMEKAPAGAVQSKSKELALNPSVHFVGVQSLNDLEVGDEIQVEVQRGMFGKSRVKQLTSLNQSTPAQALTSAQSAASAESENLKEELGAVQSKLSETSTPLTSTSVASSTVSSSETSNSTTNTEETRIR